MNDDKTAYNGMSFAYHLKTIIDKQKSTMNIQKLFGFIAVSGLVFALQFNSFAQKGTTVNVTLKVNETYQIKLPSTPSTFKGWEMGYPCDSAILKYQGHKFVQDVDTAKAGSPGKDIFTFKAMKPGETNVQLMFKGKYEQHIIKTEEYLFKVEK